MSHPWSVEDSLVDRSSLECQSGHATGHGWWWVRYILVNDEVSNLNIFYNYPTCIFFLLQFSLKSTNMMEMMAAPFIQLPETTTNVSTNQYIGGLQERPSIYKCNTGRLLYRWDQGDH